MTYSRPSAPSSPVVDSRHRKHRGPINKRACQKCRQGKVKCDGNAETGSTCSNCDPGQCHYDQSPRKNKQVETLKKQIDNISAQLEVSKKAVETFKKRDALQDRQDEVMKNLTKRVEYFVNRLDVFSRLMSLLVDGHYLAEMLVLIDALLGHFDTQQQPVDEIINHLERWADICSRLPRKSALRNIINPSEQAKSLTSNFRAAAQGQINNLQIPHPRPLESPPPSVQHSPTTAPAVQLNGVPIPAVITTQGADLHSPVISDDASSHSSYGTSEEFPRTPVSVSPQLGGHSPSPSSPVPEFVTADNCQFFTTQQQQTHQLQLQHQQQQQREEGQQHNQSLHLQHHQQQQQQHILQQHQQQQHQQAHHIPQQELLNSLMSQEPTYLDSAMMDPTLLGYTPFAYQNFDGAEEPIPES